MNGYWTCSGRYIGVSQNGYLVSYTGHVIGKFYGNEIYNADGTYIGEILKEKRLVKNKNKTIQRRPMFSRGICGTITTKYCDIGSLPLVGNFEDFDY
ncbi:MAG: hypothetical protein KH366_01275 [Clostridiaceae bacterium]|nr:hypothetical protein [Clostridiaceae bacterium]